MRSPFSIAFGIVRRDIDRFSNYVNFISEFNMDSIAFPVKQDQIEKLGSQNSQVSVCVTEYDDENDAFVPLYATKFRNRQHHVH